MHVIQASIEPLAIASSGHITELISQNIVLLIATEGYINLHRVEDVSIEPDKTEPSKVSAGGGTMLKKKRQIMNLNDDHEIDEIITVIKAFLHTQK